MCVCNECVHETALNEKKSEKSHNYGEHTYRQTRNNICIYESGQERKEYI